MAEISSHHASSSPAARLEIAATRKAVDALKARLHEAAPHVKSAHLSEALAASLGYKSNAALLAHLKSPLAGENASLVVDAARLKARLENLGYTPETNARYLSLDAVIQARTVAKLVATEHAQATPYRMDAIRVGRNPVGYAAPETGSSAQEVPPEDLSPTPLERCHAYGVRLMRKANGAVFAHHNVGGVIGPCRDEHDAAQQACAAWDI